MKLFTATDVGRRRAANEDCCDGHCKEQGLCWVAVCDGMGGERGGAIASKLACSEIRRVFESALRPGLDDKSVESLLHTAILNANAAVYDKGRQDPDLSGMGTTAVIAIIENGKAHLMHAGDSRAYKITKDYITQITKDHSVVQMLVDRGDITPQQAQTHKDRHLITKAVGADGEIHGEYSFCTLEKGELLLLCSDGLYNMVDTEELKQLSLEAAQEQSASCLIHYANEMGGIDNITAALILAD